MTEGVHVLYHEAQDVDGLASSVLRLFRDSALRTRMSAANRELALEFFMADRVAEEYADLYQEILATRCPDAAPTPSPNRGSGVVREQVRLAKRRRGKS
jgi:hypothetical protein